VAKNHYEVLGVTTTSTTSDVRTAYRKLALLHHPDRSRDPNSKAVFLAASEAFEVLSDPDRRRQYDARLVVESQLRARKPQPASRSTQSTAQTPSGRLAEIKLDVNRLNALYSRSNFTEAEVLARSVLDRDRRQPVPYAVLGDIARMRGDKNEAIRMYGNAIQFDPGNPVYRRRYEDLVDPPLAAVDASAPLRGTNPEQKRSLSLAFFFGMGLIVVACSYIVLSRELPLLPGVKLISTWTVGMFVMLFFSGVVLGSSLALDGLVANYNSMTDTLPGRTSPTVALATIAVVNFWAAVAMYVMLGLKNRSFNNSTSRVMSSVAVATCMLAFAGEASSTISGAQVVLWGGNLVYLGALCGWMVTDALRAAS
jgi:curved DNA-binding protein CbpA